MKNANTPERQALQRDAREISTVSYLFAEALPKIEKRIPRVKHFSIGEILENVVNRLDGCAGELEIWLNVSPWRDRGTLPGVRTTMRKAVIALEAFQEVLVELESEDLQEIETAMDQLEKDYKSLVRRFKRHLECLIDPSIESTLTDSSSVDIGRYRSALDILASL